MKRWTGIILLPVVLLAGAGMQGGDPARDELSDFRGVLLNEWCFQAQPTWLPFVREHGIECAMMPQCYLSGYLLVEDERNVYRLDRRGELLARKVLQTTRKPDNFAVIVRGLLVGRTIYVERLEEQ